MLPLEKLFLGGWLSACSPRWSSRFLGKHLSGLPSARLVWAVCPPAGGSGGRAAPGRPPTVCSVREETQALPRWSLEAIALGHTFASEGAFQAVISLTPFVLLRVMGTRGRGHCGDSRVPWRRCPPYPGCPVLEPGCGRALHGSPGPGLFHLRGARPQRRSLGLTRRVTAWKCSDTGLNRLL